MEVSIRAELRLDKLLGLINIGQTAFLLIRKDWKLFSCKSQNLREYFLLSGIALLLCIFKTLLTAGTEGCPVQSVLKRLFRDNIAILKAIDDCFWVHCCFRQSFQVFAAMVISTINLLLLKKIIIQTIYIH